MTDKPSLDYWRKTLAGEKPPAHDGDPQLGYYRKRSKNLETNEVWWTPVAYFPNGLKVVGMMAGRDMTANELTDLWTQVCNKAIPYEVYADFEGRVDVPDSEWPRGLLGEPKRPPFANKQLERAASNGVPGALELEPERTVDRTHNLPPEVDPVEEYRESINNAIGAAPTLTPTTPEELARLEGSKNRIAELRLAANKEREALIEPHLREQQRINGLYRPIIVIADTAEKALGRLATLYHENERQRIAKEAAEAAAKAAEEEERNARAADRAIINGEEPPPPAVERPAAVAPPPAVKPTHGTRTTKPKLQWWVDIKDQDQVYAHFKNSEQVQVLLKTLALAAVRGGLTVPGVEGYEALIEREKAK